MAVVVVTDSSSRLQPEDLERCGIRQVPLHILVDGKDFRDGVDDVPADIHRPATPPPRARRPPNWPTPTGEALTQSGGDGVVAVHISAALSSTYSSAVSAAREFGPAVRVVNSQVGRDGRRLRRAGRRAAGGRAVPT